MHARFELSNIVKEFFDVKKVGLLGKIRRQFQSYKAVVKKPILDSF